MDAYARDLASLANWFVRSVPQPSETDAALGRILHRDLLRGEPVESEVLKQREISEFCDLVH